MRYGFLLLHLVVSLTSNAQVFVRDEVDRPPIILLKEVIDSSKIFEVSHEEELRQFYYKLRFPILCNVIKLCEEYRLTFIINEFGEAQLDTLYSNAQAGEYAFDRWKRPGRDTLTVVTYPPTCGGYNNYQPVLADTLGCRERIHKNLEGIVAELPQYAPAVKDGHPVSSLREIVLLYLYKYR